MPERPGAASNRERGEPDAWATIRTTITEASHEQAEHFEEAGAQVAELRESIEATAPAVEATGEVVSEALVSMRGGVQAMERLSESADSLTRINANLEQVNQVVKQVEDYTGVISRIAADSRMLSVNAAIEAAKAGDAGRGFGVVATSVRELADSSAEAAVEIGRIVDRGLSGITEAMREILGVVERNQALTREVRAQLSTTSAKVEQVSALVSSLVDARERQSEAARQISARFATAAEDNSRLASELIGQLTGATIEEVAPAVCARRLGRFTAIVDVRRVDEFCDALGHVEGAVNIPIGDTLQQRLDRYPRDGTYLFVCRSGGRSSRAARIAQTMGFLDIYNLAGGMLAWNAQRLPVAGSNG